jgi:hypothetical protein
VPKIARSGQEMRRRMAGMAMAELTRLGATVMPVQGTTLSFNVQVGQTWTGGNEGLATLADLGQVPWLSLESAPVNDTGLAHVAKLADSGLTRLFLGSSAIRGDGLPQLAPLKNLQYLSLKQLQIDDERLAALPEFPDLQYLGLDGTRVTDRGLAETLPTASGAVARQRARKRRRAGAPQAAGEFADTLFAGNKSRRAGNCRAAAVAEFDVDFASGREARG